MSEPPKNLTVDRRRIAETVSEVLGELSRSASDECGESVPLPFAHRPALYQSLDRFQEPRAVGERAVVTVTGANRTGIVAAFTARIAEMKIDVLDISQTLISNFFAMIIIVDLGALKQTGRSFREFKERLTAVASEQHLEIMVVHEDILNAMHRI